MKRLANYFSAFLMAASLGVSLEVALGVSGAWAMGSDSQSSDSQEKQENTAYRQGREAIEAQDWAGAIASLEVAAAETPENADVHNYLGYAYRKSGDYDRALASYRTALRLDPEHRGAHEYIGEAYVELGDMEKANEHLEALDRICSFGCAEYTELKNAIAAKKATN